MNLAEPNKAVENRLCPANSILLDLKLETGLLFPYQGTLLPQDNLVSAQPLRYVCKV